MCTPACQDGQTLSTVGLDDCFLSLYVLATYSAMSKHGTELDDRLVQWDETTFHEEFGKTAPQRSRQIAPERRLVQLRKVGADVE